MILSRKSLCFYGILTFLWIGFSPFGFAAIEEVHLLPMSHLDLGFSDPVDTVAMQYKENIDQVIALCEQSPDIYWTIEELWQLEKWMERSSAKEIERLRQLILADRIEVGALDGTYRSGLMGIEDSNRLLYPMKRMQEKLDIPFYTAIQNDVPGYANLYPRVLADAGIPYFLTGLNLGFGGGTTIPRHENPFHWKSADGRAVLAWLDYDCYIATAFWGLHTIFGQENPDDQTRRTRFHEGIQELEDSGYPHRVFALIAAAGDNKPPIASKPLIDFVRKWNEKGENPRLVLSTPKRFFERLAQGTQLELQSEYRGHFHGLWDARLWNPAGNTLARQAQRQLPAVETLASLQTLTLNGPDYSFDIRQGYHSLMHHIEHTCGSDPGWLIPYTLKEVKRQNELTLRYSQDAAYTADRIKIACLNNMRRICPSNEETILVFNSVNWERDAEAHCTIPYRLLNKELELVDEDSGLCVSYEKFEKPARLEFMARNLPAVGFKRYFIKSREPKKRNENSHSSSKYILENSFYRIAINRRQGFIESLFDKQSDRELVDGDTAHPFNSLYVTSYRQTHTGQTGKTIKKRCRIERIDQAGYQRVIISRKGSLWPDTTITLYNEIKRIDFTHTVDRNRMPDVSMENHSDYYHIAFPFSLDENNLQIHVDGPDGFYRYPQDYLSGSSIGTFQGQFGIHLQEGNRFGITLSSRQAFNWTIGEVNFVRKNTDIDSAPPSRGMIWNPPFGWGNAIQPIKPTVYSNIYQFMTEGITMDMERTYFRQTEPGSENLQRFDYSLTSTEGPFLVSATTRFCREAAIEPFAIYLSAEGKSDRNSMIPLPKEIIRLSPDNVIMLAFKKAEFGDKHDYILRLKELDGKKSDVQIQFPIKIKQAWLSNLLEESLPSGKLQHVNPFRFEMEPYAVQTVRLRFQEDKM